MKKPKTMREKFAAALIRRGEKEVESRSGRFLTFTCTSKVDARVDDAKMYYFIGTAGSLRVGPSRTRSLPCIESFKQQLIKEATL